MRTRAGGGIARHRTCRDPIATNTGLPILAAGLTGKDDSLAAAIEAMRTVMA
jgi:hypothetical protein